MQKFVRFYSYFFCCILFLSCGATPGLTNLTPDVDKNLPVYTYLDSEGNTYTITANKLIYDPASAENTIDGVEDQGYHLELNIRLNDYTKIAAVCDSEIAKNQEALPPNYKGFTVPKLIRQSPESNEEIDLSLRAVQEINYIIKPYLKDE